MLLKNPNLNLTILRIVAPNNTLFFHLIQKYNITLHTRAWIGKNLKGEILNINLTKQTLQIMFFSHEGRYTGKGQLGQDIPLFLSPTNATLECTEPTKLGNFLKPSTNLATNTGATTINNRDNTPPNELTLNILFVYSPEVVKSYTSLLQLIADNNALCAVAAGIFSENSPKYKVKVVNAFTFCMPDMQYGRPYLTYLEVRELLESYLGGAYPQIDVVKKLYRANVVVLTPLLNDELEYYGHASTIGFTTSWEASLALSRSMLLKNIRTSAHHPTVLTHEIGHLLGCTHPLPPNKQPDSRLTPGYGHATFHRNEEHRNGTVMSYAEYRIPYFSNPNLFRYPNPDKNKACGVKGISEAYKVVELNLPRLATSV